MIRNNRKYFNLILMVLCVSVLYAQVPQAFSFQGVALNTQGSPISSTEISIEIKILQGSSTGEVKYVETHKVTTNTNGLYTLSIGLGMPVQGVFATIDWSRIPMFISVGIDINNGSNFALAGVTQLLSVPYAIQAGQANTKTKIYVRPTPYYYYNQIYLYNGGKISPEIKYSYQWIDGIPEDVYIEFQGLPDNINLISTAENGYYFPNKIINTSKVDTIINGIFPRLTSLKIADSTVNITKGVYPLNLQFKTKNEILANLQIELKIKNTFYEDCYNALPIIYNLKSNDCPEINDFIVQNVVIDEYSTQEASISNVLGAALFDKLFYFNINDCSKYYFSSLNGPKIIGTLGLSVSGVKSTSESIIFTIRVLDGVTETEKYCSVTYD
jgi:hypothetical protein